MKLDEGSSCWMCCLPGRHLHSLCLAASAALGKKSKHGLMGAFTIMQNERNPQLPPSCTEGQQLWLAWTPTAQEGKHLLSLDQLRHAARAVKEKIARTRNKRKLFWVTDIFSCHTVIMLLFLWFTVCIEIWQCSYRHRLFHELKPHREEMGLCFLSYCMSAGVRGTLPSIGQTWVSK